MIVGDFWEEDALPVPSTPIKRHSWVRVKVHCYVCRTCGTCKVNAQRDNGDWFVTWHLPTGESHDVPATPPCQVAALTPKRLKHYESAIAVGGLVKADA